MCLSIFRKAGGGGVVPRYLSTGEGYAPKYLQRELAYMSKYLQCEDLYMCPSIFQCGGLYMCPSIFGDCTCDQVSPGVEVVYVSKYLPE